MTMDDGNDEGRQWKAEATEFEGGLAPIGETGASNPGLPSAMPGAGPAMARPGTASGMMVRLYDRVACRAASQLLCPPPPYLSVSLAHVL